MTLSVKLRGSPANAGAPCKRLPWLPPASEWLSDLKRMSSGLAAFAVSCRPCEAAELFIEPPRILDSAVSRN
jgi:hypothetical protein